MIHRSDRTLICFLSSLVLIGVFSSVTFAADCKNNWMTPSSQTMETQNIAVSLTDYVNGERHFSMRQGTESAIDVYYLKGALLVKGPPAGEIERIRDTVYWLPMVFIVPTAVLSQAVPKGPCSVSGKTSFSVSLSGGIGIGPGPVNGKLKKAEGIVERVSQDEIAYQFKCDVEPAPKNGTIVIYKGTLKLSPQDAVKDDINIKGYTLVGQTRPFPVIGSSELPVTTLGDLRHTLVQETKAPKPSSGDRFVAYDNGTVLDTKTNLMWAAKDNGSHINWQDAKDYCKNYRGGGYTDWRMPTQDELAGLYDESLPGYTPECFSYDDLPGSIPKSFLPVKKAKITNLIHLTCCCPWASETRGSEAAYFHFFRGNRLWCNQSADLTRALPVRSVK